MKTELSIDTVFRENYSTTESSDITFVLPEPIKLVKTISITAMEFPNCWYAFSEKARSNEFAIRLHNCPQPRDLSNAYPPVITHTIKIPEGNYLSGNLVYAINNLFSNLRNGLEYLYFDISDINTRSIFRTKRVGDDDYNIYLDSDLSGSHFWFEIDFSIPGVEFNTTAGWMLGFRRSNYAVQVYPHVDNYTTAFYTHIYHWYLKSESSYGSTVQNYVFLDVNDYSGVFLNNTMGRIAVKSGMNTTVVLQPSDLVVSTREYTKPIVLSKLRIRLLDKYGNPVNMNGNDYSFMLQIEQ
jgi:hypothetical protein